MALSNEIGIKGRYSIFQNAKGEIMIMLDSRVGGPENPRFVYDGGERALLYRSQECSVAINNIAADARVPLKAVSEILIVEIDNNEVEREYVVPVRLVKSVENLIIS